jgi:phosphocarrier protein HPr
VIERSVTVANALGLHARPAAQLVRVASGFRSQVELVREDMAVNAKSIMGVMMLAAEHGSRVVVRADGPDETEAVQALATLISTGFGES